MARTPHRLQILGFRRRSGGRAPGSKSRSVPPQNPITVTGLGIACVVSPLPNWPPSPFPQQRMLPVTVSTQVCMQPAETATASLTPRTVTGQRRPSETGPNCRGRTTAHRKPYVNGWLAQLERFRDALIIRGSRQVHEFGSDRHPVWSSYPHPPSVAPCPRNAGCTRLGRIPSRELPPFAPWHCGLGSSFK